jgi:hypothetical protein
VQRRWQTLGLLVQACLPEEARPKVERQMREMDAGSERQDWVWLGMRVFENLAGAATVLFFGWVIHNYMMGGRQ